MKNPFQHSAVIIPDMQQSIAELQSVAFELSAEIAKLKNRLSKLELKGQDE